MPSGHMVNQCPDWDLAARLAWTRRFGALVAARERELCSLIGQEVHKPRAEALLADVMPLVAVCRWHARHARRVLRPRRLRGRPLFLLGQRHQIVRVPLGAVGIIATWNYPVQLLGIELVQALVAGNRVIVKPSERAPQTQEFLLTLAAEAGLPVDALGTTPATRDAGPKLLESARLDHVVFTGSTRIGVQIASWAALGLVPTTLELSGRDTALVLADADVGLAARAIWGAVVMNAGQTCMAPRRVLVDRRVYGAFCSALAPLAAAAPPARLIDAAAAARCHALCRDALALGARSLSGVCEPAREASLRPLAIADCPADSLLVQGDHFGPVVAVVPVTSVDEALRIHHACDQHLAVSVYTRDLDAARSLAPRLGATFVTVNDTVLPTVHPGASVGGVGKSGWGLTRGEQGLLAMTRAVHVSTTSARIRTPTAMPDARTAERIAGFVRRFLGRGAPDAAAIASATAAPHPNHPLPRPPAPDTPEHASSNP